MFAPEDYGTPTGTDPDVDAPLVQAAIDAAGHAGGGIVNLTNTYAIRDAGNIQCGVYAGMHYGIHINDDHVTLTGGGTLKLTGVPDSNSYCMVLVGDGGYQVGAYPGIEALLATGHICKYTNIKNLTLDSSVLTQAQMAALNGVVFSANIGFAFCQHFSVQNVAMDYGWGNNGGIGCVATCRYFAILNTTIDTVYDTGFFADGSKSGVFDGCVANGAIDNSKPAITIATSSDYESFSEGCVVRNCVITDILDGVAISGEGSIVEDNIITLLDVNETRLGIIVTVGYSVVNDCDSPGNAIVRGNTVQRPVGATYEKSWGVWMQGRNAGFGGGPLTVHDCQVTGNEFNRITCGFTLGAQAKDNVCQYNTLHDCFTEYVDASGGTASGNIIGPNDIT